MKIEDPMCHKFIWCSQIINKYIYIYIYIYIFKSISLVPVLMVLTLYVVYSTEGRFPGQDVFRNMLGSLQRHLSPFSSLSFPFSYSGIFSVFPSYQALLSSGPHSCSPKLQVLLAWLSPFQLSWDSSFLGEIF